MRGVLLQPAPLPQRLENQRDVALTQIPHAAVDQLGASTRCPLGEITAFQQQHAIAAGSRVHGGAETRRTPAHDREIPGLGRPREATQHLIPIHRDRLTLFRPQAPDRRAR